MITDENIRIIFGLKIRMLRQQKSMSLAELSKNTDISVSYLNEIEKGKKYPKTNKIASLAKALGTSYDWLVSLKLEKKLRPLAQILESNILKELPLEVFGIEPRDLIELVLDAPDKLNAFIKTLLEISRNYDLTVENFYSSVLRSYLELKENYFEELEEAAEKFKAEFLPDTPLTIESLSDFLAKNFNYEIDYEKITEFQSLNEIRSVLRVEADKKILYINPKLSEPQILFILSREAGYNYLGLSPRSYAYSWVKVDNFDELLNNYKATYFADAMLIPRKKLIIDLEEFFALTEWKPDAFVHLMEKYHQSPQMFYARLVSILPRFFGINKLFFLRLYNTPHTNHFKLTKEIHLAGLHNPHGTDLNEHYCRRWVSLTVFKELEELQVQKAYKRPVCDAQISKYIDSDNQYFCISIARPLHPTQNTNCSLTIGIAINEEFKKKVKFWNDKAIDAKEVNETCERCSAFDCKERAAVPSKYEEERANANMQRDIDLLLQKED
ncbi:helix-turn-helix domain-containing protein [Rapidithrix thailandica]|uniref:Helix-turn-helix domain-containing protein n=1 Tax=Rapidithrix thailandica TaxID=413964 RepID=A0AAW9RUP0_9BACT